MKMLTFVFSVLFTANSFASLCKVYGITDSPQKIDCTYQDDKDGPTFLNIWCEEGKYLFEQKVNDVVLNKGEVQSTFHGEVETGSNPIGFTLNNELSMDIVPSPDNATGYALGTYKGSLYSNISQSGGPSSIQLRCKTKK